MCFFGGLIVGGMIGVGAVVGILYLGFNELTKPTNPNKPSKGTK